MKSRETTVIDGREMNGDPRVGFYGGNTNGISRARTPARTRKVTVRRSRLKSISRPKSIGPIRAKRRRAMMVSALIAVAAVVVIVASVAMAPATVNPNQPAGTNAPAPPYFVLGYTKDSGGSILTGCSVNITDVNTGAYNNTLVSDSYGYYRFDLNTLSISWATGDVINITATQSTSYIGWNETTANSALPHLWLNVTMSGTVIPEFGAFVIPVVGMLSIFAVVSLTSGRRQKK